MLDRIYITNQWVTIMPDNSNHKVSREYGEIAASGTTSAAIELDGMCPVMIELPVTVGTVISFQVSLDGNTFQTLKDGSDAAVSVTKTAAAASTHTLDPTQFVGAHSIKIVSDQTETNKVRFGLGLYLV